MKRPLAAMASLGAAGMLLLAGCPSNFCILTVNGRCEWSTCPEGAVYSDARRICVCAANRFSLHGACLTAEAANAYCGRGAHFENGACVPDRCPPGYELDRGSGYCLNPQQAGQVARNMGVSVGQNQKLGCPPGQELVIEGGQAACVPVAQTCGPDERWNGTVCRKIAECPPGSSYDAPSGGCIRIATTSQNTGGSGSYTVDLASWVRTAYGPDGGAGTSDFCNTLKKHPIAFGIGPGASQWIRSSVQVQVPGGDVAHARVVTRGTVENTGLSVPAKGGGVVQDAAQAILGTLVAGGGKANVEAGATNVRCQVVNAQAPTAVTVTGGA
jgi:hypothetical protein